MGSSDWPPWRVSASPPIPASSSRSTGCSRPCGPRNPLADYPNRDWERLYRDIFRHDRTFTFLCAPNDTHNCLLRGFVKNNVLVRIEPTQGYGKATDLSGHRASHRWDPRCCQKGLVLGRRLYGDRRVKGAFVRRGFKEWVERGFPRDPATGRAPAELMKRGWDGFVMTPYEQAYALHAKALENIATTYSGERGAEHLRAQGYDPAMFTGVPKYATEDPFDIQLAADGPVAYRSYGRYDSLHYYAAGEVIHREGTKQFAEGPHVPTPTKAIWLSNSNSQTPRRWRAASRDSPTSPASIARSASRSPARRPRPRTTWSPRFEFMSIAALKEAAALGDGEHAGITRDAQTKFVTDHLGRWAPAFANDLAGASALPYYAAAAALLVAWMMADVAALGARPDAIPGRSGVDPVQGETFACPMAPEDAEVAPAPGLD